MHKCAFLTKWLFEQISNSIYFNIEGLCMLTLIYDIYILGTMYNDTTFFTFWGSTASYLSGCLFNAHSGLEVGGCTYT